MERSVTASAVPSASAAPSPSAADHQQLVTAVTRLLTLTSTPFSPSRLAAVIAAHSPHLTLLKTRRLTMLSKLRQRMLGRGQERDWAEAEAFLERLQEDGAQVDRIVSIVSYMIESSKPTPATAAAPVPPSPAASASAAPRSPPRSSSAAPVRVFNTPMVDSAPPSPSPALTAPPSLSTRSSAPTPTAAGRSSSAFPYSSSVSASPAASGGQFGGRSTISSRLNTPSVEGRRGEERQREDDRKGGWEEEETLNASLLQQLVPATPSASSAAPVTLLSRPASDADLTDLCYGDQVTLQLPSALYASLDPDFLPQTSAAAAAASSPSWPSGCQLHALSPHPFLLRIVNAKTPSDRSPIRLLDAVSFTSCDEPQLHLTLAAGSAFTLAPSSSPSSRFILYSGRVSASSSSSSLLSSLSFLSVRGSVKHGDLLVLKASSGLYLGADEEGGIALVERPTASSVLTVRKGGLPLQSDDVTRVLQSHLHIPSTPSASSASALSSLSLWQQEQLLVADALYALLGIDGQYMSRPAASAASVSAFPSPAFVVSEHVTDVSHRALLSRLLPLCADFATVSAYVTVHSRHEYGSVQHALVSALAALLGEYELMIAGLSSQDGLSLSQLSFHLSSAGQTLRQLSSVLQLTAHQVGGSLLNTLQSALQASGDESHRQLLLLLLSAASAPFLAMLSAWLYTGSVSDRHGEFAVREDASASSSRLAFAFNSSYWEERWQLVPERLPAFLSSLSEKLLVTGKYLNVIRECGRDVSMPVGERRPLRWTGEGREHTAVVEQAYAFASQALLSLLLTEYGLLSHLNSCRQFFLLAQADWLLVFLDAAESELSKPMLVVQRPKLQSLLSLALKSSQAAHDPHHELLSCSLQPHSLMQKIEAIGRVGAGGGGGRQPAEAQTARLVSGLDAFSLSYSVQYPLSLLLSATTLSKYQLLFRQLFNLRTTERLLSAAWLGGVSQRRTGRSEPGWSRAAALFLLRSQMSAFISAVLSHFSMQVLEPRYSRMQADVQQAASVDAVIAVHLAYLDACLRECLITDAVMLALLDNCVQRCRAFVGEYESWAREADQAAVREAGAGFDAAVLRLLRVLRERSVHGHDSHLSLLLSRLDGSEFYTRKEQQTLSLAAGNRAGNEISVTA